MTSEPYAPQGAMRDVSAPSRATLDAVLMAAAEPGFWAETGPAAELPFGELLSPLAHWATRQVQARCSAGFAHLSPEAAHQLTLGLCRSLARLAVPSLYADFNAMRSTAMALGGLSGRVGVYARFIARIQGQPGLSAFLREYPVLARHLGIELKHWMLANSEFLDRLAGDHARLSATFGPWTRIDALEPALSDPHNSGRMVCGLTLDNGRTLLYKPRDVRMEAAFHALLGWTSAHGADWGAGPFMVLPQPGYGWVERIARGWPEPGEQTHRFDLRSGMLLGLLHVLGTTDVHLENVIPTPEGYVLVDMETLFSPFAHGDVADPDGARKKWWLLRDLGPSVLQVGMLPSWQAGGDGSWVNVAPLGRVAADRSYTRRTWAELGTDALKPAQEVVSGTAEARGVGEADRLVEGFEAMLTLVRRHSDALLAPDGPLAAFEGLPLRFIRRDTSLYGAIFDSLNTPSRARDEAKAAQALQQLRVARSALSEQTRDQPVLDAELAALRQLDIPLFHSPADGTTVVGAGMASPTPFWSLSGLEVARMRVAAVSEAEQQTQAACIRQALAIAPRLEVLAPLDVVAVEAGATREALRAAALRLAVHVTDGAIARQVGPTWLALGAGKAASSQELVLGLPGLYDGGAGAALALGAIARLTEDPARRVAALQAFAPLRHVWGQTEVRRALAAHDRSLDKGLASGIYALALGGALLDEPDLYDEALALALALKQEHLNDDRALDVLQGAAGLLLGLLALHAAAPDPRLLARADWCGRHLLASRTEQADGTLAWQGPNGKEALPGFAHGQAGIALALTRLFTVTGEQAYRDAAIAAYRFEDRLIAQEEVDPSHGWPVAGISGWCNGTPGIALGRLEARRALGDEAGRAVSDAWLHETAERPAGSLSVCCGLFGRVDVLLEAACLLERPDLELQARRLAAAGVAQLESYMPGDGRLLPGSFFRGLAGAAYGLTRVCDPQRIPSVLMLAIPISARRLC